MKIKVVDADYDYVMSLKRPVHERPVKQSKLLRNIIKTFSKSDLKKVNFTYSGVRPEELSKDKGTLVLMNHSSFVDLEIIGYLFGDSDYHIVTTSDAFVGKYKLLTKVGCIPTNKFVTQPVLIKDIIYTLKELKSNVVMYPEASYSFDGTCTPLPESLGKTIRMLDCDVMMIKTKGAFLRDPLYNNLQVRKVDVSAYGEIIIKREDIKIMTADQINDRLKDAFDFDNFRDQRVEKIKVDEPFRADYLNRVLYKCPHCHGENMIARLAYIACNDCNATYELDEYGVLTSKNNETIFDNVPDWYKWENECVKKEIDNGEYLLDLDVTICMMVDYKAIYKVSEGRLIHNNEGFTLTSNDGLIEYRQLPSSSYGLYADYYWYELGDIICIGDGKVLYYCFPKGEKDVVAKARLATQYLYKKDKALKEEKNGRN